MKQTPPNKKTKAGSKVLPPRYGSYNPKTKTALPPSLTSEAQAEVPRKDFRSYVAKFFISFTIILLITVLVLGVWDYRNISSASQKMFGSGSIFDLLSTQPLNGSERGRINILLIGYSVDDPGHPAADLTDSIIVLSMSTTSQTGYILSIPRDLYVNIPGFGYAKINEAYKNGGAKLLSQLVSSKFQLPIDYYALINYASVRDSVNALGGIDVTIKSSDPRGLYDPNINKHDGGPLKLTNGTHHLDGQTALNLTRARGDAYGSYGFAQADFDRTQHQRQVLAAIKDQLNWKLILNPVKNSEILDAFADNVKTNIKTTEIRSIFGLFNSIASSKLKSISLRALNGTNYLSSYTTPYGQSALIPAAGIDNYSQIDEALAKLNQ